MADTTDRDTTTTSTDQTLRAKARAGELTDRDLERAGRRTEQDQRDHVLMTAGAWVDPDVLQSAYWMQDAVRQLRSDHGLAAYVTTTELQGTPWSRRAPDTGREVLVVRRSSAGKWGRSRLHRYCGMGALYDHGIDCVPVRMVPDARRVTGFRLEEVAL